MAPHSPRSTNSGSTSMPSSRHTTKTGTDVRLNLSVFRRPSVSTPRLAAFSKGDFPLWQRALGCGGREEREPAHRALTAIALPGVPTRRPHCLCAPRGNGLRKKERPVDAHRSKRHRACAVPRVAPCHGAPRRASPHCTPQHNATFCLPLVGQTWARRLTPSIRLTIDATWTRRTEGARADVGGRSFGRP
jgi:hypothetical protein